MHRVRLVVRENVLSDPAKVTLEHYRVMLETDGRGWVFERRGEIVGFAVADNARRNIWALFVLPDHERLGIGRALHAAMLEWLFEISPDAVWLSTTPGTRAERFYVKAGWILAGILPSGEHRFEMTMQRYLAFAARSEASSPESLREQLEYYRARASEYDQWWLRQGRYDRGTRSNMQWFTEARAVRSALRDFRPAGRVLELAGGTGIWSEELVQFASGLTVVDGSAEMLALNAARLGSARVRYIEADLFEWRAQEQFDVVFFGFWLSHVPQDRFAEFWDLVRQCLTPAGRVFFVDSRYERTSTAADHQLPSPASQTLRRRLDDGREFKVYKLFYEAAALADSLKSLGWNFDIRQTDAYFIFGAGTDNGRE